MKPPRLITSWDEFYEVTGIERVDFFEIPQALLDLIPEEKHEQQQKTE